MPTESPSQRTVSRLVEAATAAPSLHNAQPWRFHYLAESGRLELRAAMDRCLPHSDPHGRALHMGCGAALLNLRVAAAEAGWCAAFRVLPDPHDPRLLATVRPHRLDAAADPEQERELAALAALAEQIPRRHTSRQPYADDRVPDPVRGELRAAAEREGARLLFASPWHAPAVLDLARDAEGRDFSDPGRLAELAEWTEVDAERDSPPGDQAHQPSPVRDFAGRRAPAERLPAGEEGPPPQLALLSTVEDRPADWVRAGQALERALLVATAHSLSAAVSSESLAWTELGWTARDPLLPAGQVHAVLRLGYGGPASPTPRRPLHQVLDIR
ncbi:Acg family FMN-binding oxidoreductase [Streptomyces triticirhizae]|uniref:Nitroreductase n=1 Tax=Streptomyces triticirhizae TaxID=2483353 RepID=A0A3M2LP04_9ACTN|nr:nitroreductase family protein [Streptomyces triticirhizae]RMI39159.1 nitroreductase [Streptomyces triticirhizae]